jgi:hypothetical protein
VQLAHLLEQRLELRIVDSHVGHTVRDGCRVMRRHGGRSYGEEPPRNEPPAAGFAAFHISARIASR